MKNIDKDQDSTVNGDQVVLNGESILNENLTINAENRTLDIIKSVDSNSTKELLPQNPNTTLNNINDTNLIDEINNTTSLTPLNNGTDDSLTNKTIVIDGIIENNLNDTDDSLKNNTIIIDEIDKDENIFMNDTIDSLINETETIDEFSNITNNFNNSEDSLTNDTLINYDLYNSTNAFMNNTNEELINVTILNEIKETTNSYLNDNNTQDSLVNETSTLDSVYNNTNNTTDNSTIEEQTEDSDIMTSILDAIQNILNRESSNILSEFENLLLKVENNSSISGLDMLKHELENMLIKFKNTNISLPTIKNALEIFQILVFNFPEFKENLIGVTDMNNASLVIMNTLLTGRRNESLSLDGINATEDLIEYFKLVSPIIYEFIQESKNLENLIQNLMIFFGGNITETKEQNLYVNIFTLILSSVVLDYNSFINRPMTTRGYSFDAFIPIDDLGPILNDSIIMANINSYVASLLDEILNTTTLNEAIEIIDRTIFEKSTPEMINATIAEIEQINPFLYKQIKNINETDDLYSSLIIYLESAVIVQLNKTASALGIHLHSLFGFINTLEQNESRINSTILIDSNFETSNKTFDSILDSLNKTEIFINTEIAPNPSKSSFIGIFQKIIEKIFDLFK